MPIGVAAAVIACDAIHSDDGPTTARVTHHTGVATRGFCAGGKGQEGGDDGEKCDEAFHGIQCVFGLSNTSFDDPSAAVFNRLQKI
jgi:hypothetical protein